MTQPNNNRIIPLTCSGHTRPVVDLQFSPMQSDGKYYLISACKDGNPMLRDGQTGDWIGTFKGHKGAVWSARLTRGAHRAVTGSADFTAKVWDACTGRELYSFSHQHIVRTADFSPDGTRIVTGGLENKLRIFDLYRPDSPAVELEGHTATIKSAIWHPSLNMILSAGEDETVRVWDLRVMREIKQEAAGGPVSSMNLTANGEYAVWGAGNAACFWSFHSAIHGGDSIVQRHQFPRDVTSVAVHPSGEKYVVGSTDLWVRIHAHHDGKELEVHKGHHGGVHAVGYSPDGELYATGSEDGTIRLWPTDPIKSYGLWQKVDEPVE